MRTRKIFTVLLVALLCAVFLSGCAKHEPVAERFVLDDIVPEKVGIADITVSDLKNAAITPDDTDKHSFSITGKDVSIEGRFIDVFEEENIVGDEYLNSSFTEMSISGYSAFGYNDRDSGKAVHVIQLDPSFYLMLTSSSESVLFNVEASLKISFNVS